MTVTALRKPLHPAAWWGILGVVAILANAIGRLTPMALEPFGGAPMSPLAWASYVLCIVGMAYSEGYRGFHLQFAPRVVNRARTLGPDSPPLRLALAPLFCMGLMHASKKRLIISWSLTTMIVVLVLMVRQLSYPWRSIVDAGVVVGLALGTVSILWWTAEALAGRPSEIPPDLPSGEG